MPTYNCPKCLKSFNKKYNFQMHMKRKRPCDAHINAPKVCTGSGANCTENSKNKSPNPDKVIKQGNYICEYCEKNFTRQSSLKRHQEYRCKIKKDYELFEEMNDMSTNEIDLKEKIMELEQKLKNLVPETRTNIFMKDSVLDQSSTINLNNIINNTQNVNTINNVHLTSFGQEDLSFISDGALQWLMDRGFKSVPKLIEYVHFNRRKPEYHNIYIPSISRPWVNIFDKKKWKIVDKDDAIDQLMENKLDYLTKKFHSLKDDLKTSVRRKFNRFLDEQENDEVTKSMKEEIKLILYNGRNAYKKYLKEK